jgi:hypothetical protein
MGSLRSLRHYNSCNISLLGKTITPQDEFKLIDTSCWGHGLAYTWDQVVKVNLCFVYHTYFTMKNYKQSYAELLVYNNLDSSYLRGNLFGQDFIRYILKIPSPSTLTEFQEILEQQYRLIRTNGLFALRRIHPDFPFSWVCREHSLHEIQNGKS